MVAAGVTVGAAAVVTAVGAEGVILVAVSGASCVSISCCSCAAFKAGVTEAAVGLVGAKVVGFLSGELGKVTPPLVGVVGVVGVNPAGGVPCTQSALGGV